MSEAVLCHLLERSVLHDPGAAHLKPFAVNGRLRLATCSGVSWFRGHHLAVVNLYGSYLRIYRFHDEALTAGAPARAELLHELTEGIAFPEDVAVSPDGTMLAVTHSLSERSRISIHSLDGNSFAPAPGGETLRRGMTFHGVRFSPDGQHLAFTDIGSPGFVEVVSVLSRERTCLLESQHVGLKPKSVAFSPDARYAAIAWSPNAVSGPDPGSPDAGLLTLHRFDASTGVIAADPVAGSGGDGFLLRNPEMCTFLGGPYANVHRILVTDQGADVVAAFEFNAVTPAVAFAGVFAAGLAFPHGIDASSDARFVAITNYGDDTLRIHRAA